MIDIKIGKGNVISWVASEVERDMVGFIRVSVKTVCQQEKMKTVFLYYHLRCHYFYNFYLLFLFTC